MTSPYSSNLLQQPVPTAGPAPQAPMHTRSVTQRQQGSYTPMAQPQYVPVPMQPQPVYVAAPAQGGGAMSSVALALVVVLVGAVALIGAYYATTQASPSAREAAVLQNVSARDAFRDGRASGIDSGRQQALEFSSTTTAMRAAIARQKAYNAAYQRGMKAGKASYTAPRYTGGYRGGSSGRRYGGGNGYEVAAAFGQAQNIANVTGAPVDVEIY